ncbi:unnamed protein product [Lymnaea stagnalis]|uniref:Polysaccharide lyase 14 domain-containing protein n=1 Tax=Lymnaea stagnalis TaxID=6523 RepID=A0AAV2HCK3_LYMST
MLFLLFLALGVLGCHCNSYNETICDAASVTSGGQWKAVIRFSSPIHINDVIGGQLSLSHSDSRYVQVTGTAQEDLDKVCFTLLGSYTGDSAPTTVALVYALPAIGSAGSREIRSLREKRATTVWTLSSVPQTSDIKALLKPFEPYHHQWGDDSLSASTKHSSSPALTVHYAKGSYSKTPHRGGGFMTTPTHLPDGVTSLILKYDVYFENFGFGIGGKLPGLYGGVKGEGAYQCSGGNNPSTCFSLRLMWRENGDGEVYAYIPDNQRSDFNSRSDVEVNYQYGHSIMRGAIKFRNGAWQTVTEEVHLNTVHQFDGRVKFCVKHGSEAESCHEAQHLNMRNDANFFLRGLFFSTFFGGSSTNFAAPNDCHTYFRNFSLTIPSGTAVG